MEDICSLLLLSPASPSCCSLLLSLACLMIIWRTNVCVKRRLYEWTENQVQKMKARRSTMLCEIKDLKKNIKAVRRHARKRAAASTKLLNEELKDSCETYRANSVRVEVEMDKLKACLERQKEISERLSMKLDITTAEQEQTLHKLAEQKVLYCEREAKFLSEIETLERKIATMEKNEDSNKTQITALEEQVSNLNDSLCSSNFETNMLKESLKACSTMSANSAEEMFGLQKTMEQERNAHEDEINSLKNKMKRITSQLLDAESTLTNKLAEQNLYCEREAKFHSEIETFERKIATMSKDWEKDKDSYKTQITALEEQAVDLNISLCSSYFESNMLKESLKACSTMSANSAEEMFGLQKTMEQERNAHEDKVNSLKNEMKRITTQMLNAESTLTNKLAEQKLYCEREAKFHSEIETFERKIATMSKDWEKDKDSYKTQITALEEQVSNLNISLCSSYFETNMLKESLKACSTMSANSAEEMFGLQKTMEQERNAHEDEINSLKNKMKRITSQLLDAESTLTNKLAEQNLYCEREAKFHSEIETFERKIATMSKDWEKDKDSYKTQITALEEQAVDLNISLCSSYFESNMLKESLKACSTMSANSAEEMFGLQKTMEQERNAHEDKVNSLKNEMKRITTQMLNAESTLTNKLAEQKLYCEREAKFHSEIETFERKIATMSKDWEKDKDSYKTQITALEEQVSNLNDSLCSSYFETNMLKESLKACSTMCANSAEEMFGLQKTMEQERKAHEDEVNSLKSQMKRITSQILDAESTLTKKLAQKEAAENEAKYAAKFAEYKAEILNTTKLRHNFLKEEIRFHQRKAHDNMEAYRESERRLAQERMKSTDLQKELEQLKERLAVSSEKSLTPQKPQAVPPEREGDVPIKRVQPSPQNGHTSNHSGHNASHKRWDQDRERRHRNRRQSGSRGSGGYWKNPAPDKQ